MMFLDTKCKHCTYWQYSHSDFGGHYSSDFHKCTKKIFGTTEEPGWYIKAQKCKSFNYSHALSEEELKKIKRFEQNLPEEVKISDSPFKSFRNIIPKQDEWTREAPVIPVRINSDGYYPECGYCDYWFEREDLGRAICPKCQNKIDWRNLCGKRENAIDNS